MKKHLDEIVNELTIPGFAVAARTIVNPDPDSYKENQDNLLVMDGQANAIYLKDQQPILSAASTEADARLHGLVRFAILDGMGGHGHGRETAEYITEAVINLSCEPTLADVSKAVNQIHLNAREVLLGQRNYQDPGTTLTLLQQIDKDQMALFHVGDSRVYEISDTAATCLTIDHVPATKKMLIDFAKQQSEKGLGEEFTLQNWQKEVFEVDNSYLCQAMVLGNSLKSDDRLSPDLLEITPENLPESLKPLHDRRVITVKKGYTYLLATDGLWANEKPTVLTERLPEIFKDPDIEFCCDNLMSEHLIASEGQYHTDNTTFIAFRVN